MSTNQSPSLGDAVAAADELVDRGRQLMAAGGDDRARAILTEVDARGGGTKAVQDVADLLGVKPNQVYVAIRRAKNAARPDGLPADLLDRLYALELSEMTPLVPDAWNAAAAALHGVFLDETWLEQPGRLLALEAEDLDTDEVSPEAVRTLCDAARSWTRVQALAVINAITHKTIAALPTI